MTNEERVEEIRQEVALVKASGWHGDYPVEDIEFLLRELQRWQDALTDVERMVAEAAARVERKP